MKFELRIVSEDWERYQDVLNQFEIGENSNSIYHTSQKNIIFLDEKAFFEFVKIIVDKYEEDLIVSFKNKRIIIYDWHME